MSRQCARSLGVACSSRGYHASGAVIERPSTSSTVSASSLVVTRWASAGQCSIGEVLIPHPQQLRLIGAYQFQNTVDLVSSEAAAFPKAHGVQPYLGVVLLALDVNMWWFTPIARKEEETIRPNAESCWHAEEE